MSEPDTEAPVDSATNGRLKATAQQQLAALLGELATTIEPKTPDEDNKLEIASEQTASVTQSTPVSPSSPTENTPPKIDRDTAATPLSPPASDRNARAAPQSATSAPAQSAAASNPKPTPAPPSPRTQPPMPEDPRQQQGTVALNAGTMIAGALTGAFRRAEAQARAATPATPPDPRASAPQALLNRFAIKNILESLRGRNEQPAAAQTPASRLAQTNGGTPRAQSASASAGAPVNAGLLGLRDKLTSFTTQRMQPRREAEHIRGVSTAAVGVLASLQAVEQQETTGILTKIRDAAKSNGGLENVLSEMRPGGQFEDLRKEFNTVLSHDEGFAAAYDQATGAIADYAETRAALSAPSRPRGDPNLARLQTLDQEITEAVKTLPGIKDGQSAFEDMLESGKEAVQKLFSAVQQTVSRNADLRGPSPSPGPGW